MSIKFVKLTLIGISIGLWLALSKGTFFILSSAVIIFFVLKHSIPKEDRAFIFKVIIIGLIFRIILAILYYYCYLALGYADILGPDGECQSQHAWYISRLLVGQDPYRVPNTNNLEMIFTEAGHYRNVIEYFKQELPPVGLYQIGIFSYLIGILYALFDYSPFLMKFINSIFSIFTGIFIYFIGKEAFNSKVAKASMALFIFSPLIFIFSITALKEPIIIFLLTMILWLMMKFKKDRRLLWLILVVFATIALEYLRFRLGYLVALVIAFMFLFWRTNILRKTVFVIFICLIFLLSPTSKKAIKHTLEPVNFFSGHVGYVNTPGNNYKLFPDRCYYQSQVIGIGPIEITRAFMKGILHLLFEPLPNRLISKGYLFAFFESVLLYLFIPFVILGFCIGLRYKTYQTMPLAIYLIIFIPLIAINEGNVGAAIRHRGMLMPFLILLGVAGYYVKLGKNNSDLLK